MQEDSKMNFTRHLPTNNRTNAQGRNTMLTSRWNKTRQLLKGCLFGGLITVLSVTGAQATDIRYFHNDHLGTPQVMTDENQTVVWDAEYDPFGKATLNAESVTNNVRFPGQYYDEETGLHYNYFRTYDPSTGRYITSDPIGLNGGISTYGYVGQNPLIRIDPTGEFFFIPFIPVAVNGLGGLAGHVLGATVVGGVLAYNLDKSSSDSTDNGEQCDDEDNDCKMEFVREVYWAGETKTCWYKEPGNDFYFPQDKELPCMPVNKDRCIVDTSFMGPKARKVYGRGR